MVKHRGESRAECARTRKAFRLYVVVGNPDAEKAHSIYCYHISTHLSLVVVVWCSGGGRESSSAAVLATT